MTPTLVLLVSLATVGDGVVVRVDEVGEMPLTDAAEVADQLAAAINASTGRVVTLDDLSWACDAPDGCVGEIRARARSTDVVYLRLFRGPINILVNAKRVGLTSSSSVTTKLSSDPARWAEVLGQVASDLFPNAEPQVVVSGASIEPEPESSEPAVVPWVLIGSGAVLASVGLGFGISSNSARDALVAGELRSDDYERLNGRRSTHGSVANVMFIGATVSVVIGVVTLLL